MSYYSELEENIKMYNHYLENCIYEKKYYKPIEAPWRTRWIKDLQEGEREVYEYGIQNPVYHTLKNSECKAEVKGLPIEVTSFSVIKDLKPQIVSDKIYKNETYMI